MNATVQQAFATPAEQRAAHVSAEQEFRQIRYARIIQEQRD